MTTSRGGGTRIDTTRLYKPIVVILALAAAYFGLVPFLLPELGAQLSGFVGKDIFIYRLTGAASFGFTVALAMAWRDGWRGLRIPIAGMAVFAVGSIIATVLAIAAGEGTWIVWVVLVASAVFLGLQVLLLTNPPSQSPAVGSDEQHVADWVIYLVAFGSLAALATGGLALLLGGAGGTLLGGYSGTDSVMYRQVGAATLGSALAGYLAVRSRRWVEMRGALWGALAFNGMALVAARRDDAARWRQPAVNRDPRRFGDRDGRACRCNPEGRSMTMRGTARLAAMVLTIVGAGALGLALFVAPDRVADALQLDGRDPFAYRSGGAAFLGYAARSSMWLVLVWR
jgi:hypothetical protein